MRATSAVLTVAIFAAALAAPRGAEAQGLSVWAGGGVVSSSGAPATEMGSAARLAVVVPTRAMLGPVAFSVRVDGGFSQEALRPTTFGAGNVQSVAASIGLRASLREMGRVTPYLLAGLGAARISTLRTMMYEGYHLPSTSFIETVSETVGTHHVGAGAYARLGRVGMFAEVHQMVARQATATRSVAGTLGLVFSLSR